MNGFVGRVVLFTGALACVSFGQEIPTPKIPPEPQWRPALAYGGAPECPRHVGSRTYRSEVVRDSGTTAFITGTAVHNASGCKTTAEVQVNRLGKLSHFKLVAPNERNFSLVDFSPNGAEALLAHDFSEDEFRQYREVSVGLMSLTNGSIEWHNTWDIFGWKDCDAMIEPQGFLPDGRVVIRARKTVVHGHTHPDCVNEIGLYASDLTANSATRLPDPTKVVRYGERKQPSFQACKSDPDIVGECFAIHGRLSAWNGTPTMRIWRIGTTRILGVQDDIMPESLAAKLDWGIEAYGDFNVCPFKRQRQGEMQMVCIEGAEHVLIKKEQ